MRRTSQQRGFAALLDFGAAPAIALLYFVAVERFYPFRRAFELDPDEGIQTVLASLIARGHPLYHETWTDHGPLLPHLLRAWFDLFGWDVDGGRLLVLLFAASIVFALYDLTRLAAGHRAALCTVLLLCASGYFVVLSVSLMVTLPSIACAILSVWALVRGQLSTRPGWLLASGILMAVSLGIKLITAFLLPVIAVWLVAVARRRGDAHPFRTGTLWLLYGVVPAVTLLVSFAGVENLGQLRAAASGTEVLSRYGFLGLGTIVLKDWPLVLLAAIGTLQVARRRRWELSVWPLWVGAALAVLIGYAPVWYHHYLLLSVAACPCAGVALAEALRPGWLSAWRRGDYTRIATAAAATAAVVWLIATLPGSGKLRPRAEVTTVAQAEPILDAMRQLGERTEFVLTDAPMFAFRAGLTVVPELAVVTMKRMAAGDLTAKDVVATIERRAPEQILLAGRFSGPITDAVVDAIRERYRLVLRGPPALPVLLYARRSSSP